MIAKVRLGVGLLAGWVLWCSAAGSLLADPPVAQMLQYRPRQAGVNYTIPTTAEQADCAVKLVSGKVPNSSGWLLYYKSKDQPLRRFLDSDGDRKIDTYSYYKNGLEVYREIDTNNNRSVDQYRWYNTSGMRWGIDKDEDGIIDSWRMISAEEVALEAYRALKAGNFARLKVLLISDAELQKIGLPKAYQDRIRSHLNGAETKFKGVVAKLGLTAAAKLQRIEPATPQCVPGGSIGVPQDLFRHPTRTVLYSVDGKQLEMIQTGEMLKVGAAWRLLDVPSPNGTGPGPGPNPIVDPPSPELQKLTELLAKLDEDGTKTPVNPTPGPNKAVVAWNLKRVALIEQMLPHLSKQRREMWLKQIGDNLQQASLHSESGDTRALTKLRTLRDAEVRKNPTSKMAAFMTYRVMWAEFAPKLIVQDVSNLAKVQKEWLAKLEKFVDDFPQADDTPDALYQIATSNEFNNKEAEAKSRYQQMVNTFSTHPMAEKARGAIRRLDLEGKALELKGRTLSGATFDIAHRRGKVVAVYFWASYCPACVQSFQKLKKLHDEYGRKGFEIVTVNLDDTASQAKSFLQTNVLPGHHLFVPGPHGGMSSPLATQYGIMGLPTMFFVGNDGRVISRNLPINDLEDAIQNALK